VLSGFREFTISNPKKKATKRAPVATMEPIIEYPIFELIVAPKGPTLYSGLYTATKTGGTIEVAKAIKAVDGSGSVRQPRQQHPIRATIDQTVVMRPKTVATAKMHPVALNQGS